MKTEYEPGMKVTIPEETRKRMEAHVADNIKEMQSWLTKQHIVIDILHREGFGEFVKCPTDYSAEFAEVQRVTKENAIWGDQAMEGLAERINKEHSRWCEYDLSYRNAWTTGWNIIVAHGKLLNWR